MGESEAGKLAYSGAASKNEYPLDLLQDEGYNYLERDPGILDDRNVAPIGLIETWAEFANRLLMKAEKGCLNNVTDDQSAKLFQLLDVIQQQTELPVLVSRSAYAISLSRLRSEMESEPDDRLGALHGLLQKAYPKIKWEKLPESANLGDLLWHLSECIKRIAAHAEQSSARTVYPNSPSPDFLEHIRSLIPTGDGLFMRTVSNTAPAGLEAQLKDLGLTSDEVIICTLSAGGKSNAAIAQLMAASGWKKDKIQAFLREFRKKNPDLATSIKGGTSGRPKGSSRSISAKTQE
jgi:hypothetical protein